MGTPHGQVLDADAVGRAQRLTAASLNPGAVQSGRSARRAVEHARSRARFDEDGALVLLYRSMTRAVVAGGD